MKTLPIAVERSFAVEGPRQGMWTYEAWEMLPRNDYRFEVLDGNLYATSLPKDFHQWIISRLIHYVGIAAEDQGLAQWRVAPIGVIMPGCEPVQPDFVLVLKENSDIIRNKRIYGVPDLIAEVLSPGSKDYDEGVKLEAYANAGVPEYVVIDPSTRKLRLYSLNEPGVYSKAREFSGDDIVRFAWLPSIEFRLSILFEGAPDTTAGLSHQNEMSDNR